MLFCFCGTATCALFWRDTVSLLPLRPEAHGWKSSLSSSTKLLGNSPTMRRSRFSRPIHHEPSPALSTSIRSPSMNPRSRLVCRLKVAVRAAAGKQRAVRPNSPLRPKSTRPCTSTGTASAAPGRPCLLPSALCPLSIPALVPQSAVRTALHPASVDMRLFTERARRAVHVHASRRVEIIKSVERKAASAVGMDGERIPSIDSGRM
jgi:hypothetical protein